MGNIYAFMAGVAFLVFVLLIRCSYYVIDEVILRKRFMRLIIMLMIFSFFDFVWGLIDGGTLPAVRGVFYAFSFGFHLFATLTAVSFYHFIRSYISFASNTVLNAVCIVPVFAAFVLLCFQFQNECIFTVSQDNIYASGPMRNYLFCIQMFYYAITAILSLLSAYKSRHKKDNKMLQYIAIEVSLCLIIVAILQSLFPNLPYYNAGCLLAVTILFNGSLVIRKEKYTFKKGKAFEKKEEEYTAALKRAYDNENVIMAEFLRMQTIGFIAADMDENIILANEKALEMFGVKDPDYRKMKYPMFISRGEYLDTNASIEGYNNLLSEHTPFSYELKVDIDNGIKIYKADARYVQLPYGADAVVTCYMDITANKTLEERLRVLSETDPLTGIDNRRSGEDKIKVILDENPVGIYCLIDIDNFKSINDNFGHQVGDKTLIAVVEAIKATFRNNDIIMRVGGDEFGVYAKGLDNEDTAKATFARLFEHVEQINIPEMNGNKVTISLGASFMSDKKYRTFDDFYREADRSMYECKGKEGNNYTIY